MKIVYIITGLGKGGAESQLISMANHFVGLGHDVHLVSLIGSNDFDERTFKFTIHKLNLSKSIISLMKVLVFVRRILKQIQPDIVHAHMFHANLFSRLLKVISPNHWCLVNTAHSMREGGILRSMLYRISNRLCQQFTHVSSGAREEFVRQGAVRCGNDMIVIYNGIDTNRFHPSDVIRNRIRSKYGIPEYGLVYLAVGTNNYAKNFHVLIQAFNLTDFDVSVWLIVIGSDTELLASSVKNDKVVCLSLGIQDAIEDFYCAADILVSSSRIEGFPMVIGEAMSSALDVIATNVGGTAEWGVAQCNLVKSDDASALSRIIKASSQSSNEYLKTSGNNNRQLILRRYSLEAIANEWLVLYIALSSGINKGLNS